MFILIRRRKITSLLDWSSFDLHPKISDMSLFKAHHILTHKSQITSNFFMCSICGTLFLNSFFGNYFYTMYTVTQLNTWLYHCNNRSFHVHFALYSIVINCTWGCSVGDLICHIYTNKYPPDLLCLISFTLKGS